MKKLFLFLFCFLTQQQYLFSKVSEADCTRESLEFYRSDIRQLKEFSPHIGDPNKLEEFLQDYNTFLDIYKAPFFIKVYSKKTLDQATKAQKMIIKDLSKYHNKLIKKLIECLKKYPQHFESPDESTRDFPSEDFPSEDFPSPEPLDL